MLTFNGGPLNLGNIQGAIDWSFLYDVWTTTNDGNMILCFLNNFIGKWNFSSESYKLFSKILFEGFKNDPNNSVVLDVMRKVALGHGEIAKFFAPDLTDTTKDGSPFLQEACSFVHKLVEMNNSLLSLETFIESALDQPNLPKECAELCADTLYLIATEDNVQKEDSRRLLNSSIQNLLRCGDVVCSSAKYAAVIRDMLMAIEFIQPQTVDTLIKTLYNLGKIGPSVLEQVQQINDALVQKVPKFFDAYSQKLFKLVQSDANTERSQEQNALESCYGYLILQQINVDKLTKQNVASMKRDILPILLGNASTEKYLCLVRLLMTPLCKKKKKTITTNNTYCTLCDAIMLGFSL